MNFNKNHLNSIILFIPAIITFFLILIPTLKYSWPLSWDVIANVLTAQVYAKYGLVLTNPLLNAPHGQNMVYPPLFFFLIVALGSMTKVDFFQITRFLQPVIAMLVVLSVTYVGKKFYGTIAGLSAGFLIVSSFLLGNRLIFALPENLALIFLPLSIYFYYHSLKVNSLKPAILGGALFVLILLIHPAAPLVLFFIITIITLLELFLYRNIHVFKNYGAFLLMPALLLLAGLAALFILLPHNYFNLLNNGVHAVLYFFNIPYNISIGISSYGNLGFLALIFGLIGVVAAGIKRRKKDIIILSWIIIILLLINAHWFGVNVYSYRLLSYLLIPVSILGGFGVAQVYSKLREYQRVSSKKYELFSSKNLSYAFLISIFLLATVSGVLTVENPSISTFVIKNQYGTFQIAPPTSSEVDLANWFNGNGDKTKSIMSNDLFPMTFVATQTGMALDRDLDFANFGNESYEPYFKSRNIGYVVLDKRLSFSSNSSTFSNVFYPGEVYGLFYYNGDIHANLNYVLPSFAKVVYENKDFIVLKVE